MYKKSIHMDTNIGITWISMVMILMLALPVTDSYDFKCPDTPHRKLRAKLICNSKVEKYSCLLDLQQKIFTESCSFTASFVRPGQKYVISGLHKNSNCSKGRYQPFKFYSSELSTCAYTKSPCMEEGQIIFSEGSTKEDQRCRCDYTRGYTFLSSPKQQCFCTPENTDCSCYIAKCPTISSLSPDYVCKVDPLSVAFCQQIEHTGNKQTTEIFDEQKAYKQSSIRRKTRGQSPVVAIVIITVLMVLLFIPIVINLETILPFVIQKINACLESCRINFCADCNCKRKDLDGVQNMERETDNLQTVTVTSYPMSNNTLLTPEGHIDILRKMYESLEKILNMEEFYKDLQEELSAAYQNDNYKKVLESAKRDLIRNDCGIVVAGETSAGKTTLINKFVGQKIFPTNNVAATATVCRIRNSNELMLKAYTKDETLLKVKQFDNMNHMKSVIKEFTDISHIQKEMKDKVFYADAYLHVPMLKGNVILVDTPGIGESDDLDNILLEVLPQAVSFIFVVNARNSGGIHEDRLSRIFRNILENIGNMPCFDPLEVFFLTSQWDIVDEDDDDDYPNDDSIDTGNRTWKMILNKLKKGWPGVDDSKIFQISLTSKKLGNEDEKKYTKDFQRFETKLKQTIVRNQNKRVEFYISFLQTFIQNAERGIAARLKILEISEEEKDKVMKSQMERIEAIEVARVKCKEDLERHKSKLLYVLTDMLFQHLQSNSTKEDILNPNDGPSIVHIAPIKVESVINSRVNGAIEKWFNSDNIKEKMEEASTKIIDAVKKIQLEIDRIEIDMTGIKPRSFLNEKVELPIRNVYRFDALLNMYVRIYLFSLEFSEKFHFLVHGPGQRQKRAEHLYECVLKNITMEKLEEVFANSFGEQYSKTISRLFEGDIPNKIKSMRKTNKSMMDEYLSLRLKHESFLKLKTAMEGLKTEIEIYQDTYK